MRGLGDRVSALTRRGVDVSQVAFEASFGRTSMEYYDGFVFEWESPAYPDAGPAASGGRYDALTRQLGQGQGVPAVGGVMRPALLLTLEDAA